MQISSLLSTDRGLSRIMLLEAATLVVMSALHLTGVLHVGSTDRTSPGAGFAEAVIAVVLIGGAIALARRRARGTALGAVAFAIVGFLIGISFTISGGAAIDIAYHATMLPILAATLAGLQRLDEPGDRVVSRG
jgi:hypothetical protein